MKLELALLLPINTISFTKIYSHYMMLEHFKSTMRTSLRKGNSGLKLKRLVQELSLLNNIVVIGPQRSGTRITAKILTSELSYSYVDEKYIEIDSVAMICDCLSIGNVVIQAPGLTHEMINLDHDDTGFVMVRRPIKDIIKSQKRIDWRYEGYEKSKFKHAKGDIAQIKYDFWDKHMGLLNHAFEINYTDLKDHKMFVNKSDRNNFMYNQTEKR